MLHQLIRLPLKFVPKGLVVPILSGPARGLKWVTGSGTHGCWLGTYEHDRQKRLTDILRQGDCVLDVGANVGFYTLLSSRFVGNTGQVHAFEPFPRNLTFLNRHVQLNNLANVHVHPLALSEGADRTMHFATSINPSAGHLIRSGDKPNQIAVEVTSLDALWKGGTFPKPAVMKIDVEGAEAAVLRGGTEVINACRPTILLAGHGSTVQEECCTTLRSWGYRIQTDRDGQSDGMYESTAWPN